eukprot:EG_transcript_19834
MAYLLTGVRVTNVAPAVEDEELRSWLEGIAPLVYFDRQPGGTVVVEYSRPAHARKAAIALNNRGLGGFPIHTEVVEGPLRQGLHAEAGGGWDAAPWQPPAKRPRLAPAATFAAWAPGAHDRSPMAYQNVPRPTPYPHIESFMRLGSDAAGPLPGHHGAAEGPVGAAAATPDAPPTQQPSGRAGVGPTRPFPPRGTVLLPGHWQGFRGGPVRPSAGVAGPLWRPPGPPAAAYPTTFVPTATVAGGTDPPPPPRPFRILPMPYRSMPAAV